MRIVASGSGCKHSDIIVCHASHASLLMCHGAASFVKLAVQTNIHVQCICKH